MRVAIYVRLSRDREGQTSTTRQEADCRALAQAKGWEVVEVYSDVDLSAYSGIARPGFERMVHACEAGDVDLVLIWKLDRLSRSLTDFLATHQRLEKAGVALSSYSDPIDTSTPTGRAMLQIIAVFSELESATIAYRVKNALAVEARDGRPNHGGVRPFGFEHDKITINQDEATFIREAVARFLAGESLERVCNDWNNLGIPTPTGKQWQSPTLARLLRSPRLVGYRTHTTAESGTQLYPAVWSAIIDEGTFAFLQDALEHSRSRAWRASVKRHELTGILRCGVCGNGLVRWSSHAYSCKSRVGRTNCGSTAIRAEPATAEVWKVIRACVLQERLQATADAATAAKTADDLRTVIRTATQSLEELAVDHYAKRILGRSEFLAARLPVEFELKEAEAALAEITSRRPAPKVPSTVEELDAWWKTADAPNKRALIEQYIDHITVHPVGKRTGNRFRPERILDGITWR